LSNDINTEIDSALIKLGVEKSKTIDFSLINNVIDRIEERLHIVLSEEYKTYLQNYDEVFFANSIIFKLKNSSANLNDIGTQIFDGFYGVTSKYDETLLGQIKCYYHRMPTSLIPIGECPGGNLICLGVKGEFIGKVYFWDHENEYQAIRESEVTDEINEYWDNLFLIANTFIDFTKGLEIDNTKSELDDSVIISSWLHEDLLKN
jgi:hypothetical protein